MVSFREQAPCPGGRRGKWIWSGAASRTRTMTPPTRSAIDFYDQHPISAQIILAKLEAARGTLEGLQPEDLFAHDQDHYGGLAANDALALAAQIGLGSEVVDLCAGLGGPAR